MSNSYIKSLDGVRALAIILVMTFHAGLNHFGWMGVQLFFVLSGYLITGILWKEKSGADSLGTKFKRFWARRSLRIFPLYYGYLIVLGITFLIANFPSYYPTYAPYLFTYTFNYSRLLPDWQGNPLFTHLWSLSVEEQFYLFFPLIMFLLPRRAIKYILIMVILAAPVIRFLLGEYYQDKTSLLVAADAVYWNTLSHLDAFFIGGLIPVFSLEQKIKRPSGLLALGFVLALAAGLLNFLSADTGTNFFTDLGYNHDEAGNYSHVWRYSFLNLFFASFILALTSRNNRPLWIQRVFENAMLVRMGKVSYGMYIFHWLIFVYLYARFTPSGNTGLKLLLFLPYLFTVYLVAELSFRFYESYFIKLKDRFFNKPEGRRVEPRRQEDAKGHEGFF